MKLIAALLVVTPFMLAPAYAESDSSGDRTSRLQRSIYEVAAGDYPGGYASGEVLVEGRAATMSEPVEPIEPVEPSRRLGPGSPSDPEYFQHETNIRD